MNLLLVCETAIIEHIFTLICKKLNLELTIQKNLNINERYDIIVVDQNLIDDKFNIIKQFSKKLGAISSEDLPFDKSRDFLIPRPFLPTTLMNILKEEIEIIKQENIKNLQTEESIKTNSYESFEEDTEVTVPITDYVESLADDIYNEIEENSDESIVNLATVDIGGVLDKSELSKINNILKDEKDEFESENNIGKDDWQNISDIIDSALEEVRDYEFDLEYQDDEPYKLVLNHFQMNELKPLLVKLNQSLVDKLSSGEAVDIRIVLKELNGQSK